MSCGKIQRLIELYVDGAATRPEREAVEAHVAACPACARSLQEARQLVGLLAAMPSREVGRSFEADLTAAVRHTAPVSQSAAWWERLRLQFEWRLRFPAMVAAGGLAVAVIAVVVTPLVQPPLGTSVATSGQRSAERARYLTSTLQRHEQLEQEVDAIDSSIDLSTGSVVTE
jgi:anti-sigma factor RsiW